MALTYSRPPYRRGLEPSCYRVLWWWWRVCSLNSSPIHRLVFAWAWARSYVVTVVMSRVVEALTSIARSFPRKEHAGSRVRRLRWVCYVECWPWTSRGVSWWDITPAALHRFVLFSNLEDKAGKVGFDRCTLPYHASCGCRVRWEHSSRIKCPGFRTHDRRRGSAFALEACRFTRCPFRNRLSPTIEPRIIHSIVFLYSRLLVFVLDCRAYDRLLVELRLWWACVCTGLSSLILDLSLDFSIINVCWGTPY